MQAAAIVKSLNSGADLDFKTSKDLMGCFMDAQFSDSEIKEIILALKAKGEVATEVTGFVAAMLERSPRVEVATLALDIVGTGGDQSGSVNISTTAAIIAAAAGAQVVKHGNRAATSLAGSADVIEALGIKLNMDASQVAQSVEQVGIGFCFAPQFHPAMKNVAAARKAAAVPTIFNILGPLANPAQPKSMLIGVADAARAELMAEVLAARGCVGFIVRGDDGLDEITLTTTSTIWQFGSGKFVETKFNPVDYGFTLVDSSALKGADATNNAKVLTAALDPNQSSGNLAAIRAAAVLNSAAGLLAYRMAAANSSELASRADWESAIAAATEAVSSGKASAKLFQWQQFAATL
jgi:anthranilate phosphoribosyltransferase